MKTHIYFNEQGKKELLCLVDLEIVPSAIYNIDGTSYKLVSEPIFFISCLDREGMHHFLHAELNLERVSEKP